ncbi:MAG: hypothetical protein WBM13_06590 [Bacteroidia bacterium]
MNIKSTIDYFSKNPKALFLVDALGAAFTSFLLFFVLRNNYDYFGVPANVLIYLSAIGLLCFAYSTLCYFLLKSNWTPYFRIIGLINFLYCILTMALLYADYANITGLGCMYFVGEVLIILALVYIELRVAKVLNGPQN